MAPHLSKEMHERMVVWSQDLGKDNEEIAELAGCSERTVREVLCLNREFGVPHNLNAQPRGGTRILNSGDIDYISSILDANPTLYLDEIQSKLLFYRNVSVSLPTLSRALRRLALTKKKVSAEAMERNELLRAVWLAEYGDIPAEYCVWLDESSVDDRTNQRRSGWAELGQACVCRELFIRGQRYSVLPAFSYEGYIALDIFEGSVNKEKFIAFLQEQLAPKLNPYPGPRSVVILDNCAIHHDDEVRQIIVEDCGAKLIYLPPYSPDYNPIEQSFHSLKSWLHRHEAEAVNRDCRPWLIHQAAASLTQEMAEGWIENCGYTFTEE
ncbi:hypothetical protein NLJ89_g10351 [Agrocybe chaxingu]|uniref:Tc1-like transposase DDE domain-containing protein n=1 Tax=Agrocybe chaxingu TaxID=84603 RepID=A0A9W8JQY0_9AGAR|nr:hypothetical protein NLJ89_g10351 [Agrocybe chaxingu]